MEVKSKFRKLFWVRIGICFFVFILGLSLRVRYILHSSSIIKNPILIFSLVFFVFLIYVSIGLFSIFRINVTDIGIEKILLISGKKEFIPFTIITGLKNQKIRMKNNYLYR